MAAGYLAQAGIRTTLIERNPRTGAKLMITGKGRCNVTNDCDQREFLNHVLHNPRFLYSALAGFSTADTQAFFEGLGVALKTERGRRVFPVSDQAGQIVDALRHYSQNATLLRGFCTAVEQENGAVTGIRLADGRGLSAPCVIVATGGMSYPKTGSDGNGYRLAEKLGHPVIPPRPALVPLCCSQSLCGRLAGLSLRNVTLSLWDKKTGNCLFEELGEMLFTHNGVSGPLVLSAASRIQAMEGGRYRLVLDLKPGLSEQQLHARLLRDFGQQLNKQFSNALHGLLPQALTEELVALSGIPRDVKVNSITKEQRQGLVSLLKGFSLDVDGFAPMEEAIVTAGGVDVRRVNPKTMESTLVKGLYFTGEILDVDGETGGYNLQIAFSTAVAAAKAIVARYQKEEGACL
ncbi:MAG: NAD(P)/FAD-dependent oxidoreductase [Clostridia bacterium]|nr:NAD(P)/FAD-dependent oxidoreductase [Clostridia bacterium]